MAYMREKRNTYRSLVGKFEANRLLGRPWHRRKGNLLEDPKEMGLPDSG
jgi:hypothetical protein